MSHRYFPHTEGDIRQMLESCGAKSLDDLYSDVPGSLRLKKTYDLPSEMSEKEVRDFFAACGRKNKTLACFAGAGFYDHYTPAVIPALLSRSEFLTAYTPYQPEISQGTLQYIFEYQSMMAQLTGMEVSNASMYDGTTATAEAVIMAVSAGRKKNRVLLSSALNPVTAQVIATYALPRGIVLETIPEHDGVTDLAELKNMLGAGDVAGVVFQTPNYYGILEDLEGVAEMCHEKKALMIINAPASALGVIRTPGEWGADIACGDAQSLGMPLNYGGPYLGYLCSTKSLMRKMPGRIVGATKDAKGNRVFVLTLQAREQHIRREKATSNICSNQGIMTLHAAMYLALMGPEGLREVNELGAEGIRYLAEKMEATGKMKPAYPSKPVLNEMLFTLADGLDADTLIAKAAEKGILAGVKVDENQLLVAVTEMQSKEDIDKYVEFVKSL